MEKLLSIKNNYITVEGSFGGNQGWFDGIRKKEGCGLIAMVDVAWYLNDKNRVFFMNRNAYCDYVISFDEKYVKLKNVFSFNKFVINSIDGKMGRKMNSFFKKEGLKYKARWCIEPGKKRLQKRILNMLKNDIPVIVAAGDGKKRLQTYILVNDNLQTRCEIGMHYITIIGIYMHEGKKCFEISNYGEKMYIFVADFFDYFSKTNSVGTNCLLINQL